MIPGDAATFLIEAHRQNRTNHQKRRQRRKQYRTPAKVKQAPDHGPGSHENETAISQTQKRLNQQVTPAKAQPFERFFPRDVVIIVDGARQRRNEGGDDIHGLGSGCVLGPSRKIVPR